MRNLVVIGIILLIIVGLGLWFLKSQRSATTNQNPLTQTQEAAENRSDEGSQDLARQTEIARELDTPWAIAFLPDGGMLVTERKGTVRLIDKTGNLQNEPVSDLSQVLEIGEGGLMGIALHPNFSSNNLVYLYYTYSSSGDNTLNKVVQMKFENNQLRNEQTILDQIPGAANHNGGRIKFGPDDNLYITTGDAQEPSLSQNRDSLAGKILRVTDEGKPAPDNPFNSPVYSYGHRNPQGIAWDSSGQLWETEHGPSGGGLGVGNDELNRIEAGKNYGWPEIQGDQTKQGMEIPVRHSGRNSTWAPGGAAVIGNSIFFGGLRGQALYEAAIENGQIKELKEHFKGELGRVREVIAGPDGMLYITTSNRDGRGIPKDGDDKVIKINPQKL